jgi:hypothetical protein
MTRAKGGFGFRDLAAATRDSCCRLPDGIDALASSDSVEFTDFFQDTPVLFGKGV